MLAQTSGSPTRVGVVLGTRPEVVKLAPVVAALAGHPAYEPIVVSTGQHRDLVAPMLELFGIAADIDLELMEPGQSLTDLAGRAVRRIGNTIASHRLDALVVQGDTTTTVAGALSGFYSGVPVAHVEAGLRTDDRFSPYPEEVNRRMVTQLADLHLAPTHHAAQRLLGEGVAADRVVVTGNTVVDALFGTIDRNLPYTGPSASRLTAVELSCDPVMLVTAHRRESWDGGIAAVARAVAALVSTHPNLRVVFPLHPNPVVRSAVLPLVGSLDRVVLTDPLGYADFVRVLRRADLVLTDSGGVQEEACSLGCPTLVTRDTTERPEGADAGGLLLVGTDPDRIQAAVSRLLSDRAAYTELVCTSMPFGDGHAASRVVDSLTKLLPLPSQTRTA